MRAAIVFIIMIIAIPVALFRPYYGLLVYHWMSFMRPMELAWYIRVFDYGMVLAIVLLIGYFASGMRRNPLKISLCWVLIVTWVVYALACLHAYIPTIAYSKLWEFTKVVIMCIVTVSLISTDEKRLKQLMLVIAFSAGVLGAHGLKQAIFTGGGMVKGPGGQIADNNDFALYLNMMLPIVYYVAKTISSRGWRRLFKFMAIASGIAVIFTYSRGGFIGLAIVTLILSAKANRKMLGILGLTFAVTTFLLFAPQSVMDRLMTIRDATEKDNSMLARIDAWKTAMKMIKEHPILGVGPRNFTYVYNEFSPGAVPFDTHNGYLRTAAETGLPSLVIFLFLIYGTLWKLRRERKFLQRSSGPADLINFCHGIEVGLIAYGIGNLSVSRHDLDGFYYLLAVIICIHMQAKVWAEANAPNDVRQRFELLTARLAPGRVGVRA